MAVYSDIIMVRLMLGTLALSAVTLLAILGVIAVKLFTNLAIPGWTSSAAGVLTIILLQGVMLFTISAFSVLNTRSLKVVVPRLDAPGFILSRRNFYTARSLRLPNKCCWPATFTQRCGKLTSTPNLYLFL
jgi:polyisoprenyl-phosphate glycosyltransferase